MVSLPRGNGPTGIRRAAGGPVMDPAQKMSYGAMGPPQSPQVVRKVPAATRGSQPAMAVT